MSRRLAVMNPPLPRPTVEGVRAACDEFDRENSVTEAALAQLIRQFPHNFDESHVLLKVASVNSLYSTQIYAVRKVARHIVQLDIDPLLAEGSPDIVDRITAVAVGEDGKVRHNFSFATKYCNWHAPEFYPIYDSRVDECLWAYNRQDQFSKFRRNDLYRFRGFREVVKSFRDGYKLESLTFKQLDKFLWLQGEKIMQARK